MAKMRGHGDSAICLAWSKAGLLASGSFDTTVRLWDVAAKKQVAELRDGLDYIRTVSVV